ncbi:MAG: methyltransferase [Planctomycetota bacterium]
MSALAEPASFLVEDSDVCALRAAVARIAGAGYCEAQVRDRLGLADLAQLQWRALPIYREERLAKRDALACLIDLFLLQGAIPADELNRWAGNTVSDALIRTGILAVDEKGLARAQASLFPVANCLVFSDHAWPMLPHPGRMSVPYDQVMFVGTDTRWLARATVRRPRGAALDLCTGSGIHALLAAPHSQHVLAVDINPRAVRCARFNAQATGAGNVEVAAGDLFEPARGARFDLITANPPFVPSPLNALGFRDGGRSGENIQRRIVAGLPQHLARGGSAQIVTELGERDNEPLAERVREWLGNAPLDIHVLRLREHSAAEYAIGHASGTEDTFGAYLDSVQAWSNNLKAQGYARVVAVLLAFQWSDPALGPPWTRIEEALPPLRDAGYEIEGAFCAERLARRPNLRELLEHGRLRRPGPIGMIESRVLGSELHPTAEARLLGKALPVVQWLDPVERELLIRINGATTLAELCAIAREINLDKEAVLAAVQSLLRRGLILLID